jgi:glycosyltransferase involved in cell wall biosynthesis
MVTQTSQTPERIGSIQAHMKIRPVKALTISLLTGGGDRPYALGMAAALTGKGIRLDFIGSDSVDGPQLHDNPLVNFLNLRGDQRTDASLPRKMLRLLAYYGRLLNYAARARPGIFHILWNNKIEFFDRTFLMFYYRCLGKRVVFTAHNVNARQRDGKDNWLNRLSLRIQYRLSSHIFVHTERMKQQLREEFGVAAEKVSVIPFGINNTVPNSSLSAREAKERLGVGGGEKVLLVFGGITPYKGIEYAVEALAELKAKGGDYRLLIAGKPKPKGADRPYWESVRQTISRRGLGDQVIERIEYIPDEETEVYFKAADVLLLPYTHIFQSGVLFLGYSFGLPVLAADVGSLREEIVDGKTGHVFKAKDASDLAAAIEKYFGGDLYRELERRRPWIRDYANERYSWDKVAEITGRVYSDIADN